MNDGLAYLIAWSISSLIMFIYACMDFSEGYKSAFKRFGAGFRRLGLLPLKISAVYFIPFFMIYYLLRSFI